MPTLSPVRLRAARAQAGLTQRQLGNLCDMSNVAISNYETGRVSPVPRIIGRVATALGLALLDLCEPVEDELFAALGELDECRRRRLLERLRDAETAVP
ncbi:XRE family transcriptional regulator [Streptomyces sp. WAC07149]|uniref:helix-turn-helix domain-containing protein n=1 Tax=Streptomyces sp. WAC07149 TaxID=2487425 RepID=UPI000F7A9262|nr:helix-turn-helix transcriptional regulator [Streptomyces sp. WAC07149]RST00348.1 XRE family transcriptional regulator [Streptomyces sp. WAC07149]